MCQAPCYRINIQSKSQLSRAVFSGKAAVTSLHTLPRRHQQTPLPSFPVISSLPLCCHSPRARRGVRPGSICLRDDHPCQTQQGLYRPTKLGRCGAGGRRGAHLGVQSEMCVWRKDGSQWVFIRRSWRCLPCPHSQWTGSAATSGNTQGTIGESLLSMAPSGSLCGLQRGSGVRPSTLLGPSLRLFISLFPALCLWHKLLTVRAHTYPSSSPVFPALSVRFPPVGARVPSSSSSSRCLSGLLSLHDARTSPGRFTQVWPRADRRRPVGGGHAHGRVKCLGRRST